jgi:hypothetical protein
MYSSATYLESPVDYAVEPAPGAEIQDLIDGFDRADGEGVPGARECCHNILWQGVE